MSDSTMPLGNIADIAVGMLTTVGDEQPNGLPLLTVRCLSNGRLDPDGINHIQPKSDLPARYYTDADDVLLPARSTALKSAVVPTYLAGAVINATLIRVRCKPHLEPRLLVAYLSHPEGRAQVEALSQSGTHQMNLTVKALSTLAVPVPPLDVQQRMVAVLTAADEVYTNAVAAAESRRQLARQMVIETMTEHDNKVQV